jgi:hypothetical protein
MWAAAMTAMNLQVTKLSKSPRYIFLCHWLFYNYVEVMKRRVRCRTIIMNDESEGCGRSPFYVQDLAPKWFWRESGKPRKTSITTAVTGQCGRRVTAHTLSCSWLTHACKMSTNDLNLRDIADIHKVEKSVFQCITKILQIRSLLFFMPSLLSCSFSVYTHLMLHR